MGDHTNISWCDHTFNGWEGCQKVGPGCDHCYAETRNIRYAEKGATVAPNWGPGAPRRRTSAANWRKPLKWDRESALRYRFDGTRDFVFCSSLADVFDNAVDPQWRADLFDLIRRTPNLVWLLLTKRPGNIEKMVAEAGGLPPNAALGCTVVNQAEADRDVRKLLAAKWALKPLFVFLSVEPMLGPINLRAVDAHDGGTLDALAPGGVDWVITGGESGAEARPLNPQWVRDLRDQCETTGTAFHHKQNGEFASVSEVEGPGRHHTFPDHRTVRRVGKVRAGRTLDGRIYDARPSIPHMEAAA